MTKDSQHRHAVWLDNPTLCFEFQRMKERSKIKREYVRKSLIIFRCNKELFRTVMKYKNNEDGD